MYISFEIKMAGLAMLLETVSVVFSAFYIILNFRTPVIVKGKPSLHFKQVLNHYWQNGLLIDLCGLLPFNLIFPAQLAMEELEWGPLAIVIILQVLRIVSSW